MAKMLEEILNKVRKPIIKGLIGSMILSSSPRIYSEDSRIIPLSRNNYSDKSTAGVTYSEELSKEESEEDRVQRELDIMSYENKQRVYEENKLYIKTRFKERKGLLDIREIISSVPIVGDILDSEEEMEDNLIWWRVYKGERDINDPDEFYRILKKMSVDITGDIDNKKREHLYKQRKSFFGGFIPDFKLIFSYEHPKSLFSSEETPKEEHSYKFDFRNSGAFVEKYNTELKKKLGLENSDLRKKLGLQ